MIRRSAVKVLTILFILMLVITGCTEKEEQNEVNSNTETVVTPSPEVEETPDTEIKTENLGNVNVTDDPVKEDIQVQPTVEIEPTPSPTPEEEKREIDPNGKIIALTFDDGPGYSSTSRILDVLEEYDARATFFVVGKQIMVNPEMLIRASEMGCEIGNHTYSHLNLTKISEEEILNEVTSVDEAVCELTGREVTLVRPPYGAKDEKVRRTVPHPLIAWCIDTEDWKSKDPDLVCEIIKQQVKDGDIILMHDIYATTAQAVEKIVPWLVEQGYQLVTISEMFEAKGMSLEAGEAYYYARDKR